MGEPGQQVGHETSPVELGDVFDRVSDGIIAVDGDWSVTFANAAGGESTNLSPAQMVGRSLWDVFPELADTEFGRWYRWSFDTLTPAEKLDFYEPLDAWFSVRTFPSERGMTIYFRDVTAIQKLAEERERARAAEREAHAARGRFEALVEASTDFIAIAALDGIVMYVNPGGRRLVGLDPDLDVTTTTIADYLTPEGIVASVEIEQPAVIRDGRWSGQSTLRDHRGGPPIPVTVSSFLMLDPVTHEPFALATVQRDMRELTAVTERLAALAAERRDLLDRLVVAQEQERAQIAADVHDDSVQALAAVDLRLGLLRRRVATVAPDLGDQVSELQSTIATAADRLRHLLFELEPTEADRSLSDALADAAVHIFEPTPIAWSIDAEPDVDLPPAERTQAVRVAKEALTNARAHAGATAVRIGVRADHGGVEIVVDDDGVGLESASVSPRRGHRGLQTMRDRVQIAGGHLSLGASPDGGTRVRVWLPSEPSEPSEPGEAGEPGEPSRAGDPRDAGRRAYRRGTERGD